MAERLVIDPQHRSPTKVVFCDPDGPDAMEVVKDHGLIDWSKRTANPFGY